MNFAEQICNFDHASQYRMNGCSYTYLITENKCEKRPRAICPKCQKGPRIMMSHLIIVGPSLTMQHVIVSKCPISSTIH
jgi:hypothetical protein